MNSAASSSRGSDATRRARTEAARGAAAASNGCGAAASRVIDGLTVGSPVFLTYSATLSAGAIAGNDLPGSSIGAAVHTEAEGVALNTGYVIITDEDGNGVVGESGFDYGAPPTDPIITITTTTTTSTSFVPPTTLPSCAASAYCGDGIHQPECGEPCDCPTTTQGDADLACAADTAVPPLAEECALCVGCRVDLAPCGPTTTTTLGTPTTSTTTVPGTTTTTTTTAPPSPEVCDDCLDNDGNGHVDHEDAACCAGAPLSLALRKARLVPGGLLSFDLTLPGVAAVLADLARSGLAVQVHEPGGPELVCVRISALSQRGKSYVFRDRKRKQPGAEGVTSVTLRAARADAVLGVKGKKTTLARPAQATLEVTVGIRDEVAGRCGSARSTLRWYGKRGGLQYP